MGLSMLTSTHTHECTLILFLDIDNIVFKEAIIYQYKLNLTFDSREPHKYILAYIPQIFEYLIFLSYSALTISVQWLSTRLDTQTLINRRHFPFSQNYCLKFRIYFSDTKYNYTINCMKRKAQ